MGYLQNCTGNWLSAPGPDLDMWRPQGLAFVWGPSEHLKEILFVQGQGNTIISQL